MVTKFKYGNKNIRIVTQQYKTGLYVTVYDNDSGTFIDQFSIDMAEEDYHNTLKEKYKDSLIN